VNENHHDIIEIKSHLGLPTDTYHELPQFDDPFSEWEPQMRLLLPLLMLLFLANVIVLILLLAHVALLPVVKNL
jgi:hypothetical protein